MDVKICDKCGHRNPVNRWYCEDCSESLSESSIVHVNDNIPDLPSVVNVVPKEVAVVPTAVLMVPKTELKFCTQCGQPITPNMRFCGNCGIELQKGQNDQPVNEKNLQVSNTSPVLSISCFFPGCRNPVIGQCQGYPTSCGQFYCKEHSYEKLCRECSDKKYEAIVLADFNKTANIVHGGSCMYYIFLLGAISIGPTIGIVIAGIIFGFPIPPSFAPANYSPIPLVPHYIAAAISLILSLKFVISLFRKEEEKKLAEALKNRPGFDVFYKVWKKDKNVAEAKGFLAGIAVVGLGIIAAGLSSSNSDQDIGHKSNNELEDELRRRGRL